MKKKLIKSTYSKDFKTRIFRVYIYSVICFIYGVYLVFDAFYNKYRLWYKIYAVSIAIIGILFIITAGIYSYYIRKKHVLNIK